jgi:Ca-activated chloride channel family protein
MMKLVTKLNKPGLEPIKKVTKGGYVSGNNTKEVVEYIKKPWTLFSETEFESTQMADFQSQFQWFIGFGFVLLFQIF